MLNNTKNKWLQEKLLLTDKGYSDIKKSIFACTMTNFSMMLPFSIAMLMIMEVLKPLSGEEMEWLKMWLLFGFGVISAILIFFASKNDYRKSYVASYMESENTRVSLAEHIRKLPMSVFNSKNLSELTTNLMGDVATCERVTGHIIPQIVSNLISIVVICLMLSFFNLWLALAMFATVPLAFFIIFASRGIQVHLGKKQTDAKLVASKQTQEYIEGIKVIRSFGLDGAQFSALEEALRSLMKLAIRFEVGSGIFITGAEVVLQAGVGIVVLIGTYMLIGGSISFLTLLMFLLIVTRIYGPFLIELTLLPELMYHQIVLSRMRQLMDIGNMGGGASEQLKDFSIQFEHVEFRYNPNSESIIHDLSFTLPANSITALIGPSGSGKSTVARMIARFWDVDSGFVSIGGINVKELEPEYLMSYMSFVFQDVVLFNDTIYNNIRIGNMDASHEEILAAAKAACCDEFALKLPNGYDTMLGENGSTLSGGERQRLSIARALLKNAPIVLLDEATASLDPENESLIQKAISRLISGKTVIVIAHRLRTIAEADQIIVLNEGHLEECGTHANLIKNRSLYYKLYTIQQESLGWSV